MTRFLLAVLFLMPSVANAAPKPAIAILGLDTVDKTDPQVAVQVTKLLRERAMLPASKFQLAPNSDVTSRDIEAKEHCTSEAVACMAQIGNELGASWLVFGKLETEHGGYVLNLKLLDVARKQYVVAIREPFASADIDAVAKRLYDKLTGS